MCWILLLKYSTRKHCDRLDEPTFDVQYVVSSVLQVPPAWTLASSVLQKVRFTDIETNGGHGHAKRTMKLKGDPLPKGERYAAGLC